jgi:hypothetical protein
MIDYQAELIRLVEYMEKHMMDTLWAGIVLEGGTRILAFCAN